MLAWQCNANHGTVLILIMQQSQKAMWEMAYTLGLTDQPIHGMRSRRYLSKHREGWGNRYRGNLDMPLWRPVFQEMTVGKVLWGMGMALCQHESLPLNMRESSRHRQSLEHPRRGSRSNGSGVRGPFYNLELQPPP